LDALKISDGTISLFRHRTASLSVCLQQDFPDKCNAQWIRVGSSHTRKHKTWLERACQRQTLELI
jgi:hypothetical protein